MILVIIALLLAICLVLITATEVLEFKGSKMPKEVKDSLWIGMIIVIIVFVGAGIRIGMEIGFIEAPEGCPDPIFGGDKEGCWGYEGEVTTIKCYNLDCHGSFPRVCHREYVPCEEEHEHDTS